MLDWEEIGERLHITVTEASFTDWSDDDQSRSGGGPSWWAHCEFEGRTEDGAFRPSVSISIDVFETDREAGQGYENLVSTYRDDFGYESVAVEGWWDQGARSVRYDPIGSRHWARVVHHLRHHNLYLEVNIDGGYSAEDATEEDFFALIDDLSVGLVEAVTAHLPCRPSPDATPVPVCH